MFTSFGDYSIYSSTLKYYKCKGRVRKYLSLRTGIITQHDRQLKGCLLLKTLTILKFCSKNCDPNSYL